MAYYYKKKRGTENLSVYSVLGCCHGYTYHSFLLCLITPLLFL